MESASRLRRPAPLRKRKLGRRPEQTGSRRNKSRFSAKKKTYDFIVFLKAGGRRPWETGDETQQRLGARCWSWSVAVLGSGGVAARR